MGGPQKTVSECLFLMKMWFHWNGMNLWWEQPHINHEHNYEIYSKLFGEYIGVCLCLFSPTIIYFKQQINSIVSLSIGLFSQRFRFVVCSRNADDRLFFFLNIEKCSKMPDRNVRTNFLALWFLALALCWFLSLGVSFFCSTKKTICTDWRAAHRAATCDDTDSSERFPFGVGRASSSIFIENV